MLSVTEITNYWLAGSVGSNCHQYAGNVFDVLNPKRDAQYTACVLDFVNSQRTEHVTQITMRLYVLDRLTEGTTNYFNIIDNSSRYFLQGVMYLAEKYEVSETYTLQPIEQDITDKLAGVWGDIIINVPNRLCSTEPTTN